MGYVCVTFIDEIFREMQRNIVPVSRTIVGRSYSFQKLHLFAVPLVILRHSWKCHFRLNATTFLRPIDQLHFVKLDTWVIFGKPFSTPTLSSFDVSYRSLFLLQILCVTDTWVPTLTALTTCVFIYAFKPRRTVTGAFIKEVTAVSFEAFKFTLPPYLKSAYPYIQ